MLCTHNAMPGHSVPYDTASYHTTPHHLCHTASHHVSSHHTCSNKNHTQMGVTITVILNLAAVFFLNVGCSLACHPQPAVSTPNPQRPFPAVELVPLSAVSTRLRRLARNTALWPRLPLSSTSPDTHPCPALRWLNCVWRWCPGHCTGSLLLKYW